MCDIVYPKQPHRFFPGCLLSVGQERLFLNEYCLYCLQLFIVQVSSLTCFQKLIMDITLIPFAAQQTPNKILFGGCSEPFDMIEKIGIAVQYQLFVTKK